MTRDDKTEEVRNGRDNMRHEPRNDGETNVGPYGSYLPSSRCSSRVLCPSPSTPRLRLGTKGTTKGAGFLGRQLHVVVRVFPLTSFSSFIREAVRRAAHIIIH